mgnify:FL=1
MSDVARSGRSTVTLRPVGDDDVAVVTSVIEAQDVAWWGEPDGDADDTRLEFDRVRLASGSLGAGGRLAVHDGVAVGVALAFDHGQTTLALDPSSSASEDALATLLEWLVAHGARRVDAPVGDLSRIAAIERAGFVRERSSFELERPSDVTDLGEVSWPDGYVTDTFRVGVDDQDLHDMIYSVWTDVPGHTHRPLAEWRTLLLGGASFDPSLVVLVRRLADAVPGRIAGVAVCRTAPGGVGWVNQLAVGRPDRGVGLGRALLVEGFRRLAARDGVTLLGLGVEAENATALGLYRSVGLDVAREFIHFSSP